MRKKFAIVVIIFLISSSIVLPVFAFPGTPFLGRATAKGIEVDLDVGVATVKIDIMSGRANISGETGVPVETNGRIKGVDVEVSSGTLPGVNVDLVNASTTKAYDGNTAIVFDSDSLPGINPTMSPLATTSLIADSSSSRVRSLVGWSSTTGSVNNTNVLGGIGGQSIVSVLDISNQIASETTPGHLLFSYSASVMSDVDVQMPYLTGMVDILAVDVMTATTTTTSDGTMSNAGASSNVEFLNLTIAGTPIPSPTAGEVYTVTSGAIPADVARVTIIPTLNDNSNPTNSSAQATALYIEFLAGPLSGTDILLGQTSAESSAINSPTGPTAITLNHAGTYTGNPAAVLLTISLVGIVSIMTAIVHFQRKKVFIKQQ
jgi:hypothetical protein